MPSEHDDIVATEKWLSEVKRANEYDAWGQVDEATEIYRKMLRRIRKEVVDIESPFNADQKGSLEKLCVILRERINADADDEISIKSAKKCVQVLQNVMDKKRKPSISSIPSDSPNMKSRGREHNGSASSSSQSSPVPKTSARGNAVSPRSEQRVLTQGERIIRVKHITLKDAPDYVEPTIYFSVRDKKGRYIGENFSSTKGSHKSGLDITFNVEFVLSKMAKEHAVFIEFKHFKRSGKRMSTKCYSVLEYDELDSGPKTLELYAKPIDFKRKQMELFTVKKQFMHVSVDDGT